MAKNNENSEKSSQKSRGFLKTFAVLLILILAAVTGFLGIQLKHIKVANENSFQNLTADYEDRLENLNLRLNKLEKNLLEAEDNVYVGISEEELNAKIAELEKDFKQKMEELSVQGIDNNQQQPVANKQTQEVLIASGAIIVRDLAENGESFEYETEVLKVLTTGNETASQYVDVMKKYAKSGIKGKNYLIRRFNKIFAQLDEAELKSKKIEIVEENVEEPAWYKKALRWLKGLVVAEKTTKKPEFNTQDDEVLDLVNNGHLREALNALKTNDNYNKINSKPLKEWRLQAEKYLDFNHATSSLIMNSLANLHIKEMEH